MGTSQMRVLWICAFAPTIVSEAVGKEPNRFGGWIDGTLNALMSRTDISIGICFPQRDSKEMIIGNIEGFSYYGIYINNNSYSYENGLIKTFKEVINIFRPDAIQIWGTEFPCFLAAAEAAKGIIPIICYIQGICKIIAKHYYAALPDNVVNCYTFRDVIRNDNITQQKERFLKIGTYEEKIIKYSDHIIGRTNFDKAYTSIINSHAKYHHCNESLRMIFYQKANLWSYENCEKTSIFVSQASYPIKGFHNVIEALQILSKDYPNAFLYTTGKNPFDIKWYRISSYQKYLCNLIERYECRERVVFLGTLSANKMCERYLNSNVFVSASSIENSPNSVGEAMLLGMPIVASYVGGTMDLLNNNEEGFLYQADAPYMIAYYIDKIFKMREDAKIMGNNAFFHASKTHDPQVNLEALIKIYQNIVNGD